MADIDVTGIVALLLAAGGAAYLFRARVLTNRAAAAESAAAAAAKAEEPAPKTGAAREQKTMPPTLRPASDRPPAKDANDAAKALKKTTPATPEAKTKPVVEPAKTPAQPPQSSEGPTSEPPSTKPEEKKNEPTPESKPPAATPMGTILAPLIEPKITPAPVTVPSKPFNKKHTIVGIAPPAPVPAAPVPVVDVPRLDTEEDEDVEPTRVGRYERQSIRPPVEKLVFDTGADAGEETKGAPLALAVFALAQTDPGKRRKQNEDSFLLREKDGVYVVADGMGGHRGGEHASKIAVDTIDKAFAEKTFEAEAHADLPPAASELARAIQMANASILAEAAAKPELKGMGTTLCAARFTEENRRLFLGHVGDSRCYRVRGGVMKQMTTDHTMADYGVTGPEGAHLSRALGVWPTVPIDVIMANPELNDVYLLCSDGLTKMLTNETIATQLLHEEDPKAAVERLVFFANAHGGKDNITVVLLRVVEPGWKPPSERAPDSSE